MSPDSYRAARARGTALRRARNGEVRTARVDLADLGAALEGLDDTAVDVLRRVLGDEVLRRAAAAHHGATARDTDTRPAKVS